MAAESARRRRRAQRRTRARPVLARAPSRSDRSRTARGRLGALLSPTPTSPLSSNGEDPVVARRRRIGRWVTLGKRVGYTALLIAMVMFFVGLVAGFPPWPVERVLRAPVIWNIV